MNTYICADCRSEWDGDLRHACPWCGGFLVRRESGTCDPAIAQKRATFSERHENSTEAA